MKPKIPLRVVVLEDGCQSLQYWVDDCWHKIPEILIDNEIDAQLEYWNVIEGVYE